MRSNTAIVHKGTAIFVKNKRGMPVTVIPTTPKSAINPRHRLWHICHDPIMLAAPETLPVAPITFSFMSFFIYYQQPFLIYLQPAQQFPSVFHFRFFPSALSAL